MNTQNELTVNWSKPAHISVTRVRPLWPPEELLRGQNNKNNVEESSASTSIKNILIMFFFLSQELCHIVSVQKFVLVKSKFMMTAVHAAAN